MNEKKLTALVSALAFGLAGMALVPVGMDAGAEQTPLAQANEGTDHCIPYGPEYLTRDDYAVLCDLIPSTYADELTEVIIPETYSGRPVTTIGKYAFEYAYYLDRILIPDSVTTIEPGAFRGCYMIRSFTIPDSVTVIETGVFGGCESLDTIILPDTVTQIHGGAFSTCCYLTTVVLPSQLQSIGDRAFNDCKKLQSIVIHKGLESIGKGAFSDMYNLSDVYFTGTQEEWEMIQIAEDNDALLNATIHFNYEPISKGDLNMDNTISDRL